MPCRTTKSYGLQLECTYIPLARQQLRHCSVLVEQVAGVLSGWFGPTDFPRPLGVELYIRPALPPHFSSSKLLPSMIAANGVSLDRRALYGTISEFTERGICGHTYIDTYLSRYSMGVQYSVPRLCCVSTVTSTTVFLLTATSGRTVGRTPHSAPLCVFPR